jgi:hypothetical protein
VKVNNMEALCYGSLGASDWLGSLELQRTEQRRHSLIIVSVVNLVDFGDASDFPLTLAQHSLYQDGSYRPV